MFAADGWAQTKTNRQSFQVLRMLETSDPVQPTRYNDNQLYYLDASMQGNVSTGFDVAETEIHVAVHAVLGEIRIFESLRGR